MVPMRVVGWAVMAGLAVLLMSAPAEAQQPIKDGDTLTGKLRVVPTRHPNGTKIEAYQIVSAPRMMPADDEFCESGKGATAFHLFTMTEAARKQLKPWLGKTVTVKATALFCSHTAWHIGDVAVPEWTLVKQPRDTQTGYKCLNLLRSQRLEVPAPLQIGQQYKARYR
jgi:hypothetical protein